MPKSGITDVLGGTRPNAREHNIGAIKAGPPKTYKANDAKIDVTWSPASFGQPDRPAKVMKKGNPYAGKGKF